MVQVPEAAEVTREVQTEIVPGFPITVRSVPPLLYEDILRRLPAPRPPRKHVKNALGPMFDPKTKKPIIEADEHDSGFLADQYRHGILSMLVIVHAGTRHSDSGLIFDAEEPSGEDQATWKAYYSKLLDEVSEAKLPLTGLKNVAELIMSISGMTPDETETAIQDFS